MSVVAALKMRVSGPLVEVRALSQTHNGQPVYGDPTYVGGTLVGDTLEINICSSADDGTPYFHVLPSDRSLFPWVRSRAPSKCWNLNPLK